MLESLSFHMNSTSAGQESANAVVPSSFRGLSIELLIGLAVAPKVGTGSNGQNVQLAWGLPYTIWFFRRVIHAALLPKRISFLLRLFFGREMLLQLC